MKTPRLLLFVALVLSLAMIGNGQDFVDGVDLTTTNAPWTMRILGSDLDITNVKAKPDEASAYFMMSSASSKLNVSVFIEPVNKCKSSEECRDHVLAAGNPAWGKFEQLAKGAIKDFHYFEFYRPEAMGQPVKMQDMYAQHVLNGYWVDVHISKVLYTKADRALFEKLINSISFIPKTGTPAAAFDAQIARGRSAASAWLSLWDQRKYKETYAALSSLSREGITETQWSGYGLRIMQDLLANKSRKPIAAAFSRTVPEKTERPLAVLAYHSSFEGNPSIVEIVALMYEKNGTWSVTNYIPR